MPRAKTKTGGKAAASKATKTAKKKVAVKAVAASPGKALRVRLTKDRLIAELASSADVTLSQARTMLDTLESLIGRSIKKGSVGQFQLPGIFQIVSAVRPARKARPGMNLATGEKIMIGPQPARRVVKMRAMKRLKDYVVS